MTTTASSESASTVASRRAQRTALWQDSSVFQDSFFAPDSRQDSLGNSEFASLAFANPRQPVPRSANGYNGNLAGRNGEAPYVGARDRDDAEEPAGVVVDTPAPHASRSHH